MSNSAESTQQAPDYDVHVEADGLLTDLAEMAAEYGEKHAEHDQMYRDSLDTYEPFRDARYWSLEDLGGRRAVAAAIVALQPGGDAHYAGKFLNPDGTVDIREYMAWLSQRSDDAHERQHGPHAETRQASEAHSAYSSILSLIRDDYGVGWPRFDELGGVKESDLP